MSKAQFVLARELIKVQDYEAARTLLVTVDHPLAAEWLAKLDRIAPIPVDGEEPIVPSDSETFAVDMPSLDDLIRIDPPAAKPAKLTKSAKAAVPMRAAPPKPEPDVLEYATPVDAEVAPVAPNAVPAPATVSHTAFRRPGTTETPAPTPPVPEAPKAKNVQAKSAATSGKKAPAKATPVKSGSGRASAPAKPDTQGAGAATLAVAAPAPKPTWLDWVNWLLLGTTLPGQEDKDRAHDGPPVDDRTPLDDDEAVDWRNLPSRSNEGQASDMPWLSGKIDARGSSYYGRVATMTAAPAARGPAGDALEWDFSGELPPPTAQSDDDDQPRFHVDEAETGSQKKHGHKLFDGLNLIFVGLFSCGVFAFIYSTRQSATPDGEVYTVGSEAAFVVIGLLLVVMGVWRIVKPEKTASA